MPEEKWSIPVWESRNQQQSSRAGEGISTEAADHCYMTLITRDGDYSKNLKSCDICPIYGYANWKASERKLTERNATARHFQYIFLLRMGTRFASFIGTNRTPSVVPSTASHKIKQYQVSVLKRMLVIVRGWQGRPFSMPYVKAEISLVHYKKKHCTVVVGLLSCS